MGPSHLDWVPPESFDEYRLVKALGRGSMGQVWLAHDTVLDRLVAVKFIAELPAHGAARQRFLTEARAAARVQHPNIITVYRVGEIGPRPYLISEYVRGGSLDQLARPLAWPRLLEIAIGLARGLAAAHHQGVLHRDLKPANAILSETGEVKLLDFGLAKLLPHVAPPHADVPPGRDGPVTVPDVPRALRPPAAAPQASRAPFVPPLDPQRTIEVPAAPASGRSGGIALPSVTSTGAVMGTPAYMPPEAWRGEPATPRSDVYSLGAMLYDLGAGAPPHRGDSEHVSRSALARDAPPMTDVAPGIDPRFAAVVDRCLRRDPAERFASGDAVREALEALAAGQTAATATIRPARPARARRPLPVRRAVVTGAALALAVFGYRRFSGEDAPRLAPRSMVRFAAATVRPGVFDASRRPEVCAPLDEAEDCAVLSSPERVPPVRVDAFELDVREVSNGELAAWLNAIATLWRTDPYGRITLRQGEIPLVLASEDCFGALAVTPAGHVIATPDKARWPATCVTWHGAREYCRAHHERLPRAVEWELAAKGAQGRPFPWGSDLPTQDGVAFDLRDGSEPHPRDVASSPRDVTPEGVHDLGGNVAEWVEEPIEDGRGAIGTEMIRGGSWGSRGPCHLLGSGCKRIAAAKYSKDVGFRCARSVIDGK